jgi:hypothetical protein
MIHKKRKQKIYESITAKDIEFEIVDVMEDHRITIIELVEKFYRIHLEQPTAYWGKKRQIHETVQPHCFILREDEDYGTGLIEKFWVVLFRGGFAVEIRRHDKETDGPHVAKLWFQSFTDSSRHWIATLQIVAFFYNEEQMKAALMTAIEEREWYVAPAEAKRSVLP